MGGSFDDVEPGHEVLGSAIDGELAVDIYELSPHQLAARSLRLRHEVDRLQVALAVGDVAFEKSRGFFHVDKSVNSAAQWLAKHRRVSLRFARSEYRYARRLVRLPWVVIGVLCGAVTGWHARTLTAAGSTNERLRHLARLQSRFTDTARSSSGFEFGRHVDDWVEEHYGDEAAARAEAAEAGRHAHWSQTYGDVWSLGAMLEPHWGTLFANVADDITDRLLERDWALARDEHGDDAIQGHLRRSNSQRRADALVAMAMLADAALPNGKVRRPGLTVLVDWNTTRNRICETEEGTRLSDKQTREVIALADLERAIWQADNRIAVSEKARLFTGAERRAVELRDRFCTADGCDAPPRRSEIDHVIRHEHGGPTRQWNARMRCPDDHPGRRKPADQRPLPWEHTEHDSAVPGLFDLDDEMQRIKTALDQGHGFAS